jgi:hypothetical protein
MTAYTNYPFAELGDVPLETATVREVTVLSYDGDKYAQIYIENKILSVKAGYLYADAKLTQPAQVSTVVSVDGEPTQS